MRLDPAGNLGINVTPSGTYKLQVSGTLYVGTAYEGTSRLATMGKSIAMAMVFGG